MDAGPARLIDRYALVIENTTADVIDFMDALSAIVPMKIDLDLQITLMASALILRVGEGLEGRAPSCAPPSTGAASPSRIGRRAPLLADYARSRSLAR